jgi:hypothetical protein
MGVPTTAMVSSNATTEQKKPNPIHDDIKPSSVAPSSHNSEDNVLSPASTQRRTVWNKIYNVVYWTPPRLRWDPNNPPEFSFALNVLFAFAGAFTVANLYYNHPILNILAAEFQVPYGASSGKAATPC